MSDLGVPTIAESVSCIATVAWGKMMMPAKS